MLLDVDVIDIAGDIREDDEKARDQLDLSIRRRGLLQPIVARENPRIQGRYECLAGRRRLLSHRRLGLGKIRATLVDADDVDGQLIEITENLIRWELAPLERARQMARYVQLWKQKDPELAAALDARRAARPTGDDAQADAEAGGAAPPEEPISAIKAVARATGKSVRTVQAAVTRAEKSRMFTPEQVQVLNHVRLSDRRVDRLTQVEDPEHRAQIINLIGAGMAFPECMREVLGSYEGDAEEDEWQTDEQFLADCPVREKTDRVQFDADALLWRRSGEARRAMARSIAWGKLKDQVTGKGVFFRRLLRALDAPHPAEWLQCHDCAKGITKQGQYVGRCQKCGGGGYIIP